MEKARQWLETLGIAPSRRASAADLDSFEARIGLSLPKAVRQLYQACNGARIEPLSMRLLTLGESHQMVDNWPRYGFSRDRGYVPLVEATNGDLFCVCCLGPDRGQIFHLAWAGEEQRRFKDLWGLLAEIGRQKKGART